MSEKYRLQKYLSLAGVTSRRNAELLIEEGRVKVNGRTVTEQGTTVTPGRSKVEVDGKAVFWNPERNTILLYKPVGTITTLDDPEGRPTVIDLLPKRLPRVVPVGRLDWDSEGLLLLTNDGELAHALTHPSRKIQKIYHVKLKGEVRDDSKPLLQLKEGVELDDGMIKPDRVAHLRFTGNHTWIEIELHSGKNRVIRRMCDAVGHDVLKLRRVGFAGLELGSLNPGEFRDLSAVEVDQLRNEGGLNYRDRPPVRSKPGVRGGNEKKASANKPLKRSSPRISKPAKEPRVTGPDAGDTEAPKKSTRRPAAAAPSAKPTKRGKQAPPAGTDRPTSARGRNADSTEWTSSKPGKAAPGSRRGAGGRSAAPTGRASAPKSTNAGKRPTTQGRNNRGK